MVHGIILYKYLSWEAFVKTIEGWSLKATHPTATNDPLEFIAKNTPGMDFVEKFRDPATELPLFHSFSTKVTDVAMWGRYADSARGVCLAFCFPTSSRIDCLNEDFEDKTEFYSTVTGGVFFRVKYSNERIDFPIGLKDKDEKRKAFSKMLSTKAECWRDEKEFRFIDYFENAYKVKDGNAFYQDYMQYLCGVILGERCLYNVQYVKKLFGQYRESRGVDKNKLFKSAICFNEADFKSGTQTEISIQFVQSDVHPFRFEMTNDMFDDYMEMQRFLDKIKK